MKLLDIIAQARRDLRAAQRSGSVQGSLDSFPAKVPSLDGLSVLCRTKDPYRISNGANGQWFAEQLRRFSPDRRIHLRGLHYRIVGAGDVMRPNGQPYINDETNWNWLVDDAAKAARWLKLVPFEAIVDERNAAPVIYVPSTEPEISWSLEVPGVDYEPYLPETPDLWDVLPKFTRDRAAVRQPYRLVLFGEKTSLAEELEPIAQEYGAEMILATGEVSDTLVAELSGRIVRDGRRAVVFYFSDFDPSGRQMPVSVARKFQALAHLYHADLAADLYHVALNQDQVTEYNLPSTPLKATERRADNWRTSMGREQTEIDALLALHPGTLGKIAREAIVPFYDPTLQRRADDLLRKRVQELHEQFQQHPEYQLRRERAEDALRELQAAIQRLQDSFHSARADLRTAQDALEDAQSDLADLIDEHGGTLEQPEPELSPAPEPLFTTDDDFITATLKLKAYKAYDDDE
jgi:hypothetical protein